MPITFNNKVENSGATADGRVSAANMNEIKTVVNALETTVSEKAASSEITSAIDALKDSVPSAGDTLNKLYNLIQALGNLSDTDIDTLAELNAILIDADLVKNTDQANNTVLGLVKLYTDLSEANTDGTVTQATLKTAIEGTLAGKLLPASPGAGQNGQSLRWNNTTPQWEYYTPNSAVETIYVTQSGNYTIPDFTTAEKTQEFLTKIFVITGNGINTLSIPTGWRNLTGNTLDNTKINIVEATVILGRVRYAITKDSLPDITAPSLTSASTNNNGTKINLTFSEEIFAYSLTFSKNGGACTGTFLLGANTIEFTPTVPIVAGDVITVSGTASDAAPNTLTLSNQAVNNIVSVFDPTKLSGLQLWLDASQLVGYSDGNAVSTFADFSGNNNHANQTTAGFMPTFRANILNGKPVVRFDGSNDYVRLTNALTLSDFTIIEIAKTRLAGVSNNTTISGDFSAGSANRELFFRYSNNNKNLNLKLTTTPTFLDVSTAITASNVFGVDISRRESGVWSFRRGKTDRTLAPSTSSTVAGRVAIIGCLYENNQCLDGDIAEVVIYNRSLTPSEITQIEDYYTAKYAL